MSGTSGSIFDSGGCVTKQAIDEFNSVLGNLVAGQTVFTLSYPASGEVEFQVNGSGSDVACTVINNVATYDPAKNGGYVLLATDRVVISYIWEDCSVPATSGGVEVQGWDVGALGIVAKISATDAAQDRNLGAGNDFSIASPVGVLDDDAGLTAERAYSLVRQNFLIDSAVTINLISDARFPTPQSVMGWLSNKRITSNGSVTVNVPAGQHDFSAAGVMLPHPDHLKILWTYATAPTAFARADFVAMGTTVATASAAISANYAMLQGKFGAELILPPLLYRQHLHGFGRWQYLLLNAWFNVLEHAPIGVLFNSCAVVASGSFVPLRLRGSTASVNGLCAFLSSGNQGVSVVGGSTLQSAGGVLYAAGGTYGINAQESTLDLGAVELTLDGRFVGLYQRGGLIASTAADGVISGSTQAGYRGSMGGSFVTREAFGASAHTFKSTNNFATNISDGAKLIHEDGSVGSWQIESPAIGISTSDGSVVVLPANLTSVGCTTDLRAKTLSSIVMRAGGTVTFSGAAGDNAVALTGGRIYTAGVPLPAGSTPAFGVAGADGSIVF